MTNEEAASEARRLVAGYFAAEPWKALLWFETPNPLLGEIRPCDLISLGRASALLSVVRDQLAENEPPAKEPAP